MATYRPESLTDAALSKITFSGTQDRIIDPKSRVIVTVNKSGLSFGMMVYAGGRQRWHTLGRFRAGVYGLAQARRDALQKLAEVDQHGLAPVQREHTFRDAFDRLERRHRRLGRQPRTIAGYKYSIDRYSPELWDMALPAVRRGWLRERHDDLADGTGRATALNWLRSVSPVLSEALELEWVEANVASGIRVPQTTAAPMEITGADVSAVWKKVDALGNVWVRGAWRLALLTGLRKSDIATARWEHFDAAAATLHLPEPKGGAKRAFTLPLSSQATAELAALPRLGGPRGEWLFPSQRSESGHIYDHRASGLPNPHWSRHAWSTVAERAGVDEWRRAVLLNQQPSGGVNRRYTHSVALDYRAEAQTVADALLALRKA